MCGKLAAARKGYSGYERRLIQYAMYVAYDSASAPELAPTMTVLASKLMWIC